MSRGVDDIAFDFIDLKGNLRLIKRVSINIDRLKKTSQLFSSNNSIDMKGILINIRY